ncbi:MAG: hypothetical protein HQK53_00520 [Oligoflexia bacterium]|nr:hypothetical protein [Oligoflexia bacterium]
MKTKRMFFVTAFLILLSTTVIADESDSFSFIVTCKTRILRTEFVSQGLIEAFVRNRVINKCEDWARKNTLFPDISVKLCNLNVTCS